MRRSDINRSTNETEITLTLLLDGSGTCDANTGIGFFDHMLASLSRFAMIDLNVHCVGDLAVDGHHTVEDVGICFGKALHDALGDKSGIRRSGHAMLPMDDALAIAAVDISGRAFLHFEAAFKSGMVGGLDTQLVREFFRAVCIHGGLTAHLTVERGENSHHMIEALFKAFGRALDDAKNSDRRVMGIPSTKGVL